VFGEHRYDSVNGDHRSEVFGAKFVPEYDAWISVFVRAPSISETADVHGALSSNHVTGTILRHEPTESFPRVFPNARWEREAPWYRGLSGSGTLDRRPDDAPESAADRGIDDRNQDRGGEHEEKSDHLVDQVPDPKPDATKYQRGDEHCPTAGIRFTGARESKEKTENREDGGERSSFFVVSHDSLQNDVGRSRLHFRLPLRDPEKNSIRQPHTQQRHHGKTR